MKRGYSYFLLVALLLPSGIWAAGKGLPADTTKEEPQSKLPVIGLGYGATTFIGDVSSAYVNKPFYNSGGFQLDVQLHTKSSFEISFHFLSAKTYGEEKSLNRNVNFRSSILAEGVNIRYSYHSKKYKRQVLIPFISVGIENISFDPYTDLKDADGNTYNYWQDGSIRNIAEGSGDASQAKVIHRDYTYETNVRDANLDSLGKFKQYALAFPISLGVKFKVSGRVALHFAATYHITTTDYIDGITPQSLGSRAGADGNDRLLYSSVSFHYDLAAPRETKKTIRAVWQADESVYKNINYDNLQNADADGDGIPDFSDEDNATPRGVKVDMTGKGIDSDADGVPDYRDKEMNSSSGVIVDESGRIITDSTQEAKHIKDSVDLEMMRIAERVRVQNEPAPGVSAPVGGKSKLPDEYKVADTDHDGIISPDEIAKAIELYTNGKSPFQKQQFYRLIDYFFNQ